MKSVKTCPVPILLFASIFLLVAACAGDRGLQTSASYNVPEGSAETVDKSTEVLRDFVSAAGKDIPQDVLENAAGIAVVPDLTKAAFVVGGRHGTGVLLKRDQNEWSLPVFTSITGGSLGYQIGISTTDLLLVFQDPETISKLREGSYTLGGDLTVAAGPVGGSAEVSTLDADVLAYSRTEGAFAGIAVSGSRIALDPEETSAYYVGPGEQTVRGYYGLMDDLLNPRDKAEIQNIPPNAMELKQTLDRLASGKR